MMKILDLCHEKGMKAVDSFEFEVVIIGLLDGCFEVVENEGVDVFEFPEILKNAFMANFADGDLDASEVEYHFTE
jgi:hypothetical protein